MNINKLRVKIILFLFLLLNFSCSSDDVCDDNDVAVNFTIEVKLKELNGNNHFNNNDFDISLFKVLDDNNLEREFSIIENNGENVISFEALNSNTFSFVYNEIEKYNFGLFNVNTETINCVINVVSFDAISNGQNICDCSLGDSVVITFSI